MAELLRAPGNDAALVKYGTGRRIDLHALGARIVRMTARMALGQGEEEEGEEGEEGGGVGEGGEDEGEGEVGADAPDVYSVWRWDDGPWQTDAAPAPAAADSDAGAAATPAPTAEAAALSRANSTMFVGEVFWALKHAFHAFSLSAGGARVLAAKQQQQQQQQRQQQQQQRGQGRLGPPGELMADPKPFFARAWANCLREGQVLGWHWHAESHDTATTVSANLVVAAPPALPRGAQARMAHADDHRDGGNGTTTATLFQLGGGDGGGGGDGAGRVLRSENAPGDLTLFDGELWHRTTAPTAAQLARMPGAPCRMTLAFDITDDPRPPHHFVPLYDPLDPMFQRSLHSWAGGQRGGG